MTPDPEAFKKDALNALNIVHTKFHLSQPYQCRGTKARMGLQIGGKLRRKYDETSLKRRCHERDIKLLIYLYP